MCVCVFVCVCVHIENQGVDFRLKGVGTEAVAAGSPYRYPLWLARALNSAIYDVKWDYESDRAIAKIADFYVKIAVFIINLCCCAPFCNYT